MNKLPTRFIDCEITPLFTNPPVHQKTPPCPDGFVWEDHRYCILERLAEWSDFTRRGRMSRNMRPSHATVAATRGSLGVGRFYFRVRVDTGQVFDLYYDRAPRDADDRKGHWFLYREVTLE